MGIIFLSQRGWELKNDSESQMAPVRRSLSVRVKVFFGKLYEETSLQHTHL